MEHRALNIHAAASRRPQTHLRPWGPEKQLILPGLYLKFPSIRITA